MNAARRLIAAIATAVVVTGFAAAPTARADTPIGGGGGNPDWIVQTQVAQPWTGLQASAQQIVADDHHVPNDAKLLRWARGDIRAVMFFELMAIVNTPAAQRTADQQADVDVLTNLVHDRGVTAAQEARRQYDVWQNDPCDYVAPDGYPYDPGCTQIGGIFNGTPDPPPASAFESMGFSHAYPELVGPGAIDVFSTAVEASALLSSTLTAGAIATAANLAGVFPAAAEATVAFVTPFSARMLSGVLDAAGETAADIVLNALGAAAWGTIVGVVVEAVAIAVLRGIDVFTSAAIPGTLDQAVSDAQQPTDLTAVEADSGGVAEIFTAFSSQTLPDPTVGDTSGSQPGPWNPSDATVLIKQTPDDPGTPQDTFPVENWDQTKDTVWVDHGYFVVQYPDGHREWTLDLDYTDPAFGLPGNAPPYRIASLVGNELVTGPASAITPYEAIAGQVSALCPGFPNPPPTGCVDLRYLTALVGQNSIDLIQLVPQKATNISVSTAPAPPVFGQPFTLTAQLSTQDGRVPTGSVDFYENQVLIAKGVPIASDGSATLQGPSWHAGQHTVRVEYQGNDDYDTSTTDYTTMTVARAPQTLHGGSIPNEFLNTGGNIDPGVTADSGLPITYTSSSTACQIVANQVHLLAQGTCVVTATQAGDTDHLPVSEQLSFTVLPPYTGPTVAISTPADGGTYAHGAVVPAAYSCASPFPIAFCIGTVPAGAPVDTSTLGQQTFEVTTYDGRLFTTKSVTYTVVPGAPAVLLPTAGSGQSAPAGTAYPAELTVTVKDSLGALVPGASVTFTIASGAAHFDGGLQSVTVTSDAQGVATSPALDAGLAAGPVTVTARAGSAPPATYTETVTAPRGLRLHAASPAIAGRPAAVTATALDAHGAPVGDVTGFTTLTIRPTSGGATCTGGTAVRPATCTSTATGRYTITGNDHGTTATTLLTVVAAAPAAVTATSGGAQTARTGKVFRRPLVATVTDSFGNRVPNVSVLFTVTSGSATFPSGRHVIVRTGPNGVATSAPLTAGIEPGPVTTTASSGSVSGTSAAVYLDTVETAGSARADLSVRFRAPHSMPEHAAISASVIVTNDGPDPSGRYSAAVRVPDGFTVTDSRAGLAYHSLVIFTGTDLAPGQSILLHVGFKADALTRGQARFGARVLAATRDPNHRNNVGAAVTMVTRV